MIDKLGDCPNCKKSWNGGEVLDNLLKLDVFFNKSQKEMEGIAKLMGYTPENRSKFSKATMHEINGDSLIQCPCCNNVFTSDGVVQCEDIPAYKKYKEWQKQQQNHQ